MAGKDDDRYRGRADRYAHVWLPSSLPTAVHASDNVEIDGVVGRSYGQRSSPTYDDYMDPREDRR